MDASEEKEFSLVCTLISDLCTGSHLVPRDILQTPCLQRQLPQQESCLGLCSPSNSHSRWWRKPVQALRQCVPAQSFFSSSSSCLSSLQSSGVWTVWGFCLHCCCLVTKSCLPLSDPKDCRPQGSSVHGISQARIQDFVAISFSRGSSRPREQNPSPTLAGRFFTTEPHQGRPLSLWPLFISSLPSLPPHYRPLFTPSKRHFNFWPVTIILLL